MEENVIECFPYQKSFGYAMCASAKLFRFALSRAKKVATKDTPVYICHIDELEDGQLDLLPANAYGLNILPFLQENGIVNSEEQKKKFQGFPCKPMCMAAIQTEIVALMDTDALFLTDPTELVQYEEFRTTGAIFMNDQEQFDENKLSTFIFNVLPTLTDDLHPEVYDNFRNNYIYEKWSQWKGESALVTIDKTKHTKMLKWLMWLHEPSQLDEFYKYSWGDKESFWMSCILAQETCPFNQWAVGVGGTKCNDHGNKGVSMSDNAIVQYHPYQFINQDILYINGDLIAEIISNETPLDRISYISPAKLYFSQPEWIFHQPSLDLACVEGQVSNLKSSETLQSLKKEFLDSLQSCNSHNDCHSFEFCMNCAKCLRMEIEFKLESKSHLWDSLNCFGCNVHGSLFQCAPLDSCRSHKMIAKDEICPNDCAITGCSEEGTYCSKVSQRCQTNKECCVWNDDIYGVCPESCITEITRIDVSSFRKQMGIDQITGTIFEREIVQRRSLTTQQATITIEIQSDAADDDFLCSDIDAAIGLFTARFGNTLGTQEILCQAQGYGNFTYSGNITNVTGINNSSIFLNSTVYLTGYNTTVDNHITTITDDIIAQFPICTRTGISESLTDCEFDILETVRYDEWAWYVTYTLEEDTSSAVFAEYYDPIADEFVAAPSHVDHIVLQSSYESVDFGWLQMVYEIDEENFDEDDFSDWLETNFGDYEATFEIFNSNADVCSEDHDDREGDTSEERCLALAGCCYVAENDDCFTCTSAPSLFPITSAPSPFPITSAPSLFPITSGPTCSPTDAPSHYPSWSPTQSAKWVTGSWSMDCIPQLQEYCIFDFDSDSYLASGVQTRNVECMGYNRIYGEGEFIDVVDDSLCTEEKPATSQACDFTCEGCFICTEGYWVSSVCTAEFNTEYQRTIVDQGYCTGCESGTFLDSESRSDTLMEVSSCLTHTPPCAAGEMIVQMPTMEQDRTCMACESNTFSDTTDAISCEACTICEFPYEESSSCTLTADAICTVSFSRVIGELEPAVTERRRMAEDICTFTEDEANTYTCDIIEQMAYTEWPNLTEFYIVCEVDCSNPEMPEFFFEFVVPEGVTQEYAETVFSVDKVTEALGDAESFAFYTVIPQGFVTVEFYWEMTEWNECATATWSECHTGTGFEDGEQTRDRTCYEKITNSEGTITISVDEDESNCERGANTSPAIYLTCSKACDVDCVGEYTSIMECDRCKNGIEKMEFDEIVRKRNNGVACMTQPDEHGDIIVLFDGYIETTSCEMDPCPYEWNLGEWSTECFCLNPMPEGQRYDSAGENIRDLIDCSEDDGNSIAFDATNVDDFCFEEVPDLTMDCFCPIDCAGKFIATSECTATCGAASQDVVFEISRDAEHNGLDCADETGKIVSDGDANVFDCDLDTCYPTLSPTSSPTLNPTLSPTSSPTLNIGIELHYHGTNCSNNTSTQLLYVMDLQLDFCVDTGSNTSDYLFCTDDNTIVEFKYVTSGSCEGEFNVTSYKNDECILYGNDTNNNTYISYQWDIFCYIDPTGYPTTSPTGYPTTPPTGYPTTSPTGYPTTSPTGYPTTSPIDITTPIPEETTLAPIVTPTIPYLTTTATTTEIPTSYSTTEEQSDSTSPNFGGSQTIEQSTDATTTYIPTTSSSAATVTVETLTAIEYVQTFTGIAVDECDIAAPYIQEATAESLNVDNDNVIVTPSTGCVDSTNTRRHIQESVSFIIQVIYDSEEAGSAIEEILISTETNYTTTFIDNFLAAITGSADKSTFIAVSTESVTTPTTVEIETPTTTTTATTTTITTEKATVIETTEIEIETTKATDSGAGGVVGIVVPLVIIIIGAVVMWYFGYCKKIKNYLCSSKDEEEFDDVISSTGDKNDKVAIESQSNLQSPQSKYAPLGNNSNKDIENPKNDANDIEIQNHVSPQKVPKNKRIQI